MLDPHDLLDVDAPIEPWTARRLGDAQLGKLRFPRAQHVRLHLDQVAHFCRLEQRAIGNFDGSDALCHWYQKLPDSIARVAAPFGR